MNYKFLLVSILLLLIFIGSVHAGLTDNLVSYYKFDETSGTVLTDWAGLDHNFANSSATINQTGKIDKAYLFSAGPVARTNFYNNMQTRTINIWINPANNNKGKIYTSLNSAEAIDIWRGTDKKIYVQTINSGGSWVTEVVSSTIEPSVWTMLTVTFNSATKNINLYLNGTYNASGNWDTISNPGDTQVLIGGYFQNFSGLIDETGIWSRLLTTGEITALYNNGNGISYPFNGISIDFNYIIRKDLNQILLRDTSVATGVTKTAWTWTSNGSTISTAQDYNLTATELTDYNICLHVDTNVSDINGDKCYQFNTGDWTPPVTTFSSFQVPNSTDQNITLSCTSINECKAINYNINNEGWNTISQLTSLDNNLFAWYKLDETSGTTANNYVSGGDNLTNTGTADIGVSGKIATAYDFDGTNDYLKNDTFFSGHQAELTFSAWVYPDAFGADKTIFSFRRDSDTWDIFSLHHQHSTNTLVFVGSHNSTHETYNSGYTLPTGQWSHVVLQVKDANCVQIWVNADRKLNSCKNRTFNNTMTRFYPAVYAWNDGGLPYKWDGKLDEIGVWNRILSPSEITDLYNSGVGRTTFSGFSNNIYSFLYSGTGDHNIQYYSTDNSDNNETIKTSTFTTYGTGHFHFLDENTYAPVTTTYTINPSINGITTGSATSLDLNLQGITNTTYTFTFKKTGYGTRHYYATLNEFSSFDYNQLLLQDTNGNNEVDLTIYTYNGTTILPNTPITITKNNYLIGRYLTDSTGTINPFLKDQDVNYLFNVEGYYSLGQVAILFNRPKWDTNLGDIAGTWQITLTSPQTTSRYLITTNSRKIAILPNTIEDYSAKVCMYGTSNCNTDYISRTFLLSYKGNSGETLIQPYLNLVSASTLRTLKVLNYGTAQPYPDAKLEIRTKTEAGVDYLVESVITDSTGLATTYLNDGQTYYITANDVTVYKVTPNDTVTTYYIYFNYINLPSSTITPIDVNTSNDTNTLIGQVYGVRNALFTSCTRQNDCFPAVFFSILITFLVLISVTNITQANNPVGVKGLALIAFCSLTIFFGIGWLPVYIYAFLGAISMLLVVIVQ